MALLGLCPFIVLTTAFSLLSQDVVADLHTTMFYAQLSDGFGNAAYAFGAVTAADLVLRLPQRWLFIGCEAVFLAGSLLATTATGITVFTLGRVLQGFTTGMLLVVALPPLITNYGAKKLPLSALFVNLGLFGMVTLGPVAGGIAAGWSSWRLFFASIAGLGLIGLVVGVLSYGPNQAPSPRIGFDWTAIPLAFGGTFLPFFAVSWLYRGGYTSVGFIAPLIIGIGVLLALVGLQFRKKEALVPVGPISNTLPIVGIGIACIGGAVFTVLLELMITYLTMSLHYAPAVTGGLLAPLLLGILAGSILFKRLFPSRWVPMLALSGLVMVAVAAAMLLGLSSGNAMVMVPIAGVLLGYGAGAAVAPGLFMGGLSVPSTKIGPTFALVELLRSEAAFILAPILGYVAMTTFASLSAGIHLAIGISFGLLAIVSPMLLGVLLLGGVGPHRPDLEGWLRGETTAYHSPQLAGAIRRERVPHPESPTQSERAEHSAAFGARAPRDSEPGGRESARTGTLTGTVHREGTGENDGESPMITVLTAGGEQVGQTHSTPDGHYQITGLDAGAHIAVAAAPGHQPVTTRLELSGTTQWDPALERDPEAGS
jgi:MFS family permease